MIKPITILSCLLLTVAAGFAQQTVTIKGHVTGPDTKLDKIYLSGEGIGEDTAIIKNGVFTFQVPFKQPIIAILHSAYDEEVRKMYRSAVLVIDRAGSVVMDSIALDKGMSRCIIKEMPSAIEFVQFEKLGVAAGKAAAAVQPWVQENEPGYEAKRKVFDSVYKEKLSGLLLEAVRGYGDKFSFVVTLANSRSRLSPKALQDVYQLLSPAMQASEPGKQINAYLNGLKNGVTGATVADFSLPGPDGKEIALSQLKGKYVLIDFWASWCKPCRKENPFVVKAYEKYKAKHFTVLGVSLDAELTKAAWIKAIADDGLTWTQVSDLKNSNVAADLYDVKAIPQNFLIDPQCKIIAKNLRGEELDEKLAAIL